ncbi:Spc98 family-domain-containing protein [Gorgonomyces haynaldii]|nr:Spc98 family-domain-containing protein [Gorgonomyces haynaldii]
MKMLGNEQLKKLIKKTDKKPEKESKQLLKLVSLFQGDPQKQKKLYDYSLRIMSSRLQPIVSGDELHLSELIQKKLAKSGAEKALRFTKILEKLVQLGRPRNRWEMLYFLLKISPEQADYHEIMFETVNEPIEDPHLTNVEPQSIKTAEKQQQMAAVFGTKPKVVRTSRQELEDQLVQDLIFILQGVDGTFVKFNQELISFDETLNVPAPMLDLATKIAELGWLYRKVSKSLERLDTDVDLSQQSLLATIRDEQKEYYKLVAIMETHTQLDPEQRLTLKRLYVWTSKPLQKLRIHNILLEACEQAKGGEIISIVHSYSLHGDPFIKEYVESLLSRVSLPFYSMMQRWIYKGELDDPFGEFFVSTNPQMNENIWKTKFGLEDDNVPPFISRQTAKKIFLIGKTLDFIKGCGEPHELEQQQLTYGQDLDFIVNQVYKKMSGRLSEMLLRKYELIEHLQVLKDYFLLGNANFVQQLMETLDRTLSKPATTIYRHHLTGALESCLRQSSDTQIKHLDVRLLEASAGDLGWDVFALDYHPPFPVNTILNPQAMHCYLKLFSFLWRMKRTEHVLQNTWKRQMSMHLELRNAGCDQLLHQMQLLNASMSHFMTQLQHFILLDGVEASWVEFNDKMHNLDLDLLIAEHNKYLNRITIKSMLVSEGKINLTSKLLKIFDLVIATDAFQSQVYASRVSQLTIGC